jgi:predicted CXXCH cytochrome family protein
LGVIVTVAGGLVLATGLIFHWLMGGHRDAPRPDLSKTATFVGNEACAGCHRAQADLWRDSQHKHAMDHATETTVLGDFSGATFDYYGVQSRFFRKDGKFVVETDGPDGQLATFEVKYTFGVEPLQQYLVAFPDGRLQALSIAWDTRPKHQGGQRWFHLYPDEQIRHDDVLHWTKLNQNWNFMCAECHSTGVRKNYDSTADRFATTFAEISVGCEACHGQGSGHIKWAENTKRWWPFRQTPDPTKGLLVRFDERANVTWSVDTEKGNASRSALPLTLRKEVETCGLCHARRGQFSENWIPGHWLSDTHTVSSNERGLYHADGQMLDEVYNYAPFKQSKMFAAGVTCSDCHEPHSGKLRFDGDSVCLQCHASDKYAAVSHHRHEGLKPALACASCHMPERTYMGVDRRHDHSFRVPRPDRSDGAVAVRRVCAGDRRLRPWRVLRRRPVSTSASQLPPSGRAATRDTATAAARQPARQVADFCNKIGTRLKPSAAQELRQLSGGTPGYTLLGWAWADRLSLSPKYRWEALVRCQSAVAATFRETIFVLRHHGSCLAEAKVQQARDHACPRSHGPSRCAWRRVTSRRSRLGLTHCQGRSRASRAS